MPALFFTELIIIFCLSIFVVLVCHMVQIPAIVGFLVTGVLVGPHALQLVSNPSAVQSLSTIGIVLLLFTVGLEFSLKRIFRYMRYFVFGGGLQVALTILAGICIARVLDRPMGEAIFLGFLLSLSSTAIVMRLFEARSESAAVHGRLSTSILIFQDLMVIPMMFLLPLLEGQKGAAFQEVLVLITKAFLLVAVVLFVATNVVPKLFAHIAKTRIRELFLLTVLVICFAVAALSDWMGLSLSIGAFLAGLIVSESEYSYQAIGDMLPLQDIFTSLFFISIGMLLDIHFLIVNLPLICLLTLGVLLLKAGVVTAVGLVIGMPIRPALLSGFALCQIGEFSFVLAKAGLDVGIGTEFYHQLFLSVAIVSMGLTPFLIQHSERIVHRIISIGLPHWMLSGRRAVVGGEEAPRQDHLVIVGYGISGKNLSDVCVKEQIPYQIVEMNPKTVQEEYDEPILFGDATQAVMLQKAQIANAKALAIAINDPIATQRVVRQAKKLNPNLYIICRTHYMTEAKTLFTYGADEVISDELGSSIELFSRVLHYFHVPAEQIERHALRVQDAGYEMLR